MADKTINIKLIPRHDTEANWKTADPILLTGELGFSTDKNNLFKVGDGKSKWSALPYCSALKDSAGQQINTTYIKGLSVSGKIITYTKGDGTTGTITTQDTNTTYSTGTTSTSGLTKLYTSTGTATDGTMTQNAIKGALDGKLSLSGGTMTGPLNFVNAKWNSVGDDVAIGDHNVSGSLGIKGLNGTPKATFVKSDGTVLANIGSSIVNKLETNATSFQIGGGAILTYNSTNKSIDFSFN